MQRTRKDRGLARGREKDQILVKLLKADAPYEEIKRALLELEKRWLREAKTAAERQQTRRSIAEDLVSGVLVRHAVGRVRPMASSCPTTRLLQPRAARPHSLPLRAIALPLPAPEAQEAWEVLEDSERRVLRIREDHFLRKHDSAALLTTGLGE